MDGVFRKRRSTHRQLNYLLDTKARSSNGQTDGGSTQVALFTPVISAPRKRRRKEKVTAPLITGTSANSKSRCGSSNNVTVITSVQSQDNQLPVPSSSSNVNAINPTAYNQYNYLSPSTQVNEINLNRENVIRIENCLTRNNLTNSQETPPSSPDSYSTVLNVSLHSFLC